MASPLKQFVIEPIIPFEIAGVNLSFTNSSLWMIIAAVSSIALLSLASGRKSLVPGRMQAAAEMLYEFVGGMIRENVGHEGKRYFPLIFTVFMVVLMGNVLGLLPYSFTFTSHLIVTVALAALIFIMVTVFGFYNHGLKFLTLFKPPGVPMILLILIIPLEIMSFLIRPVTLSVRLFANMMAGHLMLKVIAGFNAMAISAGLGGIVLGLIPMSMNVALFALELLVAVLQAYIFAILSTIYLKDTVELHH